MAYKGNSNDEKNRYSLLKIKPVLSNQGHTAFAIKAAVMMNKEN